MAVIHSRSGNVLLDTTESLIIIGVEKPIGNSFGFDDAGFRYRCPIREELVPVYLLREKNSANMDSFDAHFCPYGMDEVHGIRVDASRNYFFTATLSGCNLGFGALNPVDGSRWVGHSNAATIGGLISEYIEGDANVIAKSRMMQQLAQTKMLQSQNPTSESLKPAAYGRPLTDVNDIRTTVIGLRDTTTNKWTFIRQNYDQSDFQ